VLNEPSISASGQSAAPLTAPPEPAVSGDPALRKLADIVDEVMEIERVDQQPPAPARIGFVGRLRINSEAAYARLDTQFAPLDYHVLLTTNDDEQHVIMALKGRFHPRPRPVWPNVVLLLLTIASLLYVGAAQDAAMRNLDTLPLTALWRGWPYALSVLLILGTHELGHYFAARHHGVGVTLPYFIPLPFGFFGTLGAFIQLREPMPNRKVLFDVGVAGPIAGFIVAVPLLMIGLFTSHVEPLPADQYLLEGNSILYAAAKYVAFGELLPSATQDVFINQVTKAGWTGLLITGLNLIPLGQLDGGHVVFTVFGKEARRLYIPIVAVFLALSFINNVWLVWTILLFFLGRLYAVPFDMVTPLDRRRKWLAYAVMIIFVLVFVPNPLRVVTP
jgi:hypothetical protein